MNRFTWFATTAALVIGCQVAMSETLMPQRFNVGGFIHIRGSSHLTLGAHSNPFPLPVAAPQNANSGANGHILRAANNYLAEFHKTTAMMLIDHGKIVFEAYRGLGTKNSEFFSMSIGKSLTSLAVGKALCDGKLAGLHQKAGAVVPELNNSNLGKSSIRQLLTMSSGAYVSWFAGQPRFIGGLGRRPRTGTPFLRGMFWPIRLGQVTIKDILWGQAWSQIENKNIHAPGKIFHYKALDTLALSVIVQRTTGTSLAQYFDRKIWQNVRSAGAGHWEADREGTSVSASGFQARLVDWGRLALWILREIKKPGCYGDYLRTATSKQMGTLGIKARHSRIFKGYGFQWWTNNILAPGFWGVGYAGQYFGINPVTQKILIKFSYGSSGRARRELFRIYRDWNRLK